MLMCRAPEAQGLLSSLSFYGKSQIGSTGGIPQCLCEQTPKQGDIYLPVMLGEGEAVMRHTRGSPGTAEVRKTLSNDGEFGTQGQGL